MWEDDISGVPRCLQKKNHNASSQAFVDCQEYSGTQKVLQCLCGSLRDAAVLQFHQWLEECNCLLLPKKVGYV